ncbi:MAG: hypothetical protein K2Q12_01790 [Rickettsiales bacterium]|nr:hypothetical protein [Rickettsiales bacterium]
MSKLFLDEAHKEHARLQIEWESSALYQRMEMLKEIIALYEGHADPKQETRGAQARSKAKTMRAQGGAITKEEEVLRLARECIKANDDAAHKRAIHQYIALYGVEVSDAALSAYLSKADFLSYDKEEGWRVVSTVVDGANEPVHRAEIMTLAKPMAVNEAPRLNAQELWSVDKNF